MNIINYLQNNQFVALLVALPILVCLNIMLGRALADFKDEFDKAKFILGIKKGVSLYVAMLVLTGISFIIVIQEVDINATILLILYMLNVSYVMQVITKIKEVFDFKKAVEIIQAYKEGTE